jgi:hypothetical protein
MIFTPFSHGYENFQLEQDAARKNRPEFRLFQRLHNPEVYAAPYTFSFL